MARAALALYEATGESGYLAAAERLANAAQEAFGDSHGGFFTTAAGAADVPLRQASLRRGQRHAVRQRDDGGGPGPTVPPYRATQVGGRARTRRSGRSVARRISCPACRRCWRPRICLRKVPAW